MNDIRPRFLDLLAIRLPLPGVTSFLHRISGVLLILAIPFALYALDLSLRDAGSFAALRAWFSEGVGFWLLVLTCWALGHHFFAGIRFLLIDIEIGVERPQARFSSWLVIAAGVCCALLVLFTRGGGA